MHSHVLGSHRAKFEDDDFNSFRGIACEGQIDTIDTWFLTPSQLSTSLSVPRKRDRQTDTQTDIQARV